MRDAAAEQGVPRRLGFVHVRIEAVARELGEALDVLDGHLALRRAERVADRERVERLAERMHAGIALAAAA